MFSTGRLLFNHIIGLLLSLYFLKCHLSDHRQIFFLSQLSVNHIRNLLHGFWTNVTFIYQSSKMCNKLFSDFTESFSYFIFLFFYKSGNLCSATIQTCILIKSHFSPLYFAVKKTEVVSWMKNGIKTNMTHAVLHVTSSELKPGDNFSCTVSNQISKKSAKEVKPLCSDTGLELWLMLVILIGGGSFLLILFIICLVCVCRCYRRNKRKAKGTFPVNYIQKHIVFA
uniref:Ig-like domain-containing protein n=1 Tax=Cyprinus carpio carpio TaxID=630221 RepID=A0A8C1EIV1_CYPCA